MSTHHDPTATRPHPSVAEWKQIVAPYEEPSVWPPLGDGQPFESRSAGASTCEGLETEELSRR